MLVLTGAAGVLASWVITLDKFKLMQDPNFTPGCSLNPVISCGNIMKSAQASVFGFPNPMLGLVAYGVVICVGASLLTGARFPRWYWLVFQAGSLFGVGFVSWLQFESLYRIGALCLWCCLAWVATIVLFWRLAAFNIRNGFLPAPSWTRTFFTDFPWVPPVLHIAGISLLILTRWWDFWTS
ncbi:vitamin K epoxide reductase family protein [Streptomyces beihaiensis]|uniref:Vitamin K epoxide reductase family protein n=1 Tax=Streptomyces beihaiensis TaxID=2984495 RepID=A0ABT3TQW4_9ACTN|nr:vitamin K epoxide reductase family protein [Streptomyces beihaiensis]MCX3059437.1 vitamin K epoxide reductase family protein [Streptomyces beihaiensis]